MRWPWTPPEPTPDELVREFRQLKADFRALQQEWDSVVDKLTVRISRNRKREQRQLEADLEGPGAPNGAEVGVTPTPDRKAALRARLAARRGIGVRS